MPAERPLASAYRHFVGVTTRWMDNDAYGHVNNVHYYSFFDSASNDYLIKTCGLDVFRGDAIDLVVESGCRYHAPVSYPDVLRVGVRVDKLGRSSVTWGLAIFREGEEEASAHGFQVHVFVDRTTRRPVPIPERIREALGHLASTGENGATPPTPLSRNSR